jgi:hypothetical protein
VIYEVPAWQWLTELADREHRRVTLADVPAAAWDSVVPRGVHVVWLMGIWERSPIGRQLALEDPDVRAGVADALGTDDESEVVASPYCVRRYTVDPFFGGRAALEVARRELAARGARLLLDFVPNHVARDHPWVGERPGAFVRGSTDDLAAHPDQFVDTPSGPFAMARDPNYPPWTDVLQLNPFSPDARELAVATLVDLADQCDGVRCDMAMLLLDDVASSTWGSHVHDPLDEPYWRDVIACVRAVRPDLHFLAEAYWGREGELLAQGFDRCFDKVLADGLMAEDAATVARHVTADHPSPACLVRFLENHDEPRAAGRLGPAALRAASVAVSTLPGGTLLLDGQLQGATVHTPVQAARRPLQPPDTELERWWRSLLGALHEDEVRTGTWTPLDVGGWEDNRSCEQLLAWQWTNEVARHVVVVNLSGEPADGLVRLAGTAGYGWTLTDLLDGAVYERAGDELEAGGLYVRLAAWGQHLFRILGSGERATA